VAKLRFDPTKTLKFVDPREVPTYSIPEVAHYLRMPESTLSSWVRGRNYPVKAGQKRFAPLIQIADPKHRLLSFVNLAEAHVLSALRRTHAVPLPNIRNALDYVAKTFQSDHPLIEQEFETNGVSLFVKHLGHLVDASARGQVVHDFMKAHLSRLERENSLVVRLYPFTRRNPAESPRDVVIDPRIGFGRPILASTGVPTASLAERYLAGESIDHLAKDYDCERLEVEEAIRCELPFETAA
jgi:uncharacterized protein (DUF433 family)